MEQYISKSDLVAEIESYKNSFCDRNGYLEDSETNGLAYDTLCELEDSIEALEVKEVDLEKEINDSIPSKYCWSGDGKAVYTKEQMVEFAKHFFELCIKV